MISSKDRILITGGSGFIGTNLIELFKQNNYTFINLDKNPPLKKDYYTYWVKGNIMNIPDLESVFHSFDPTIVIHLAARTDTLSDNLEDYIENTVGTENVIQQIKKSTKINHVIITSTQYVYKSEEFPIPNKENEYIPHTTYGESKRITEELIRNANVECKWTIIRPCNIWGPWHMNYPKELWKIIAKGLYLHPSKEPVIRTYGYVKNVVYQMNEILNAEASMVDKKTFYLGDLPIDSYFLFNSLSLGFGNKKIRRAPKFIFQLGALFGDILHKMGFKFPLYSVRYRNMIENYFAPSDITVYKFGPFNNDYHKNVKETIDWLKNEGSNYFSFYKNLK